MKQMAALGLLASIATAGFLQSSASAFTYGKSWPPHWRGGNAKVPTQAFQRIAVLPNYVNNADASEATVSEIVTATHSGRTLIYTDGLLSELGFVDLSIPDAPRPTGKLGLRGEPTSVASLRDDVVLVGVNTSASFTEPDGYLAVVD